MLSHYLNLGLRIYFGLIAGALNQLVGVWPLFQWWRKGVRAPDYNPDAIELGASLLRHVKSSAGGGGGDNVDYFTDVTITTKDGVKLHAVVDAGQRRKKGKRPIVFVHGFPELWISWMDQMEYFAKLGHPILALNMRGYGKSDKPSGVDNYHMYNHLLKDMHSVIEYASDTLLDGEKMKPLLVSHDYGSTVCWSYASQKEVVESKALAGYVSLTIPPLTAFEDNMTGKQLWMSLYMFFFNMPWLPEKIFLASNAAVIGLLTSDTVKNKMPTWMTNTYRANVLQEGAMEAQLNYYRCSLQQMPKPPSDSYCTKEKPLPLPTLIMRGLDDVALGDDIFKNLDAYLVNHKLVALDNCSHWMTADCPDEINSEIEGFLKDL